MKTVVNNEGEFTVWFILFFLAVFSFYLLFTTFYYYTTSDRKMVVTHAVAMGDKDCTNTKFFEKCPVVVEYLDGNADTRYATLDASGLRLKNGDTVKIEYPKDDPSDVAQCCRWSNTHTGNLMLLWSFLLTLCTWALFHFRNNPFLRMVIGGVSVAVTVFYGTWFDVFYLLILLA